MARKSALSRNQRKALAALLANNSAKAAAEACGLSRRTLVRYLADPDFRAELDRQEMLMIGDGARRLVQELQTSIGVLVEVRDGEKSTQAQRMRAATTIIEAMGKLRLLESIERRLEQIEARIYEYGGRYG